VDSAKLHVEQPVEQMTSADKMAVEEVSVGFYIRPPEKGSDSQMRDEAKIITIYALAAWST
jgi:hypothetical protein